MRSALKKRSAISPINKGAIIAPQDWVEKAIAVSNEEPLKKEIETFLQCVKNNDKPTTDIDEAINVQVVLDMIEKKLRENYG